MITQNGFVLFRYGKKKEKKYIKKQAVHIIPEKNKYISKHKQFYMIAYPHTCHFINSNSMVTLGNLTLVLV